MTDTLSTVPWFTIEGVKWQCWIVAGSYEWRSMDKRCQVGRNIGNTMCWARCDGRDLGTHYQGLKPAMMATARALQRKAEAA